MATKEYCPASASEIYTPMSMLDSGSVDVDLRRKYDEATSSLVQNLRDMAQHVDARLTKYEKELDAPSSAPQQKMRREKVLKNVREVIILKEDPCLFSHSAWGVVQFARGEICMMLSP